MVTPRKIGEFSSEDHYRAWLKANSAISRDVLIQQSAHHALIYKYNNSKFRPLDADFLNHVYTKIKRGGCANCHCSKKNSLTLWS